MKIEKFLGKLIKYSVNDVKEYQSMYYQRPNELKIFLTYFAKYPTLLLFWFLSDRVLPLFSNKDSMKIINYIIELNLNNQNCISLKVLKKIYLSNPQEFKEWLKTNEHYINGNFKAVANIFKHDFLTAKDISHDYCRYNLRNVNSINKQHKHENTQRLNNPKNKKPLFPFLNSKGYMNGNYQHISRRMALRLLKTSSYTRYKKAKKNERKRYFRKDVNSHFYKGEVVSFHRIWLYDIGIDYNPHYVIKRVQKNGVLRRKKISRVTERPIIYKRFLGRGRYPVEAVSKNSYFNFIRYRVDRLYTKLGHKIVNQYKLLRYPQRVRQYKRRYPTKNIPMNSIIASNREILIYLRNWFKEYQKDKLERAYFYQITYQKKIDETQEALDIQNILLRLGINSRPDLRKQALYNRQYYINNFNYENRNIKTIKDTFNTDLYLTWMFDSYPTRTRSRSFNFLASNVKRIYINKVYILIRLIIKYRKHHKVRVEYNHEQKAEYNQSIKEMTWKLANKKTPIKNNLTSTKIFADNAINKMKATSKQKATYNSQNNDLSSTLNRNIAKLRSEAMLVKASRDAKSNLRHSIANQKERKGSLIDSTITSIAGDACQPDSLNNSEIQSVYNRMYNLSRFAGKDYTNCTSPNASIDEKRKAVKYYSKHHLPF